MNQAPGIHRQPHWQTGAAVVLVCVAAVLPYAATIDDYFLREDFGVVQLLGSKPAGYFPRWFITPWLEDIWGVVHDEIRPFPAASYQLTALWGPAAPQGHHLLNIALHAVNALLVLAMSLKLAGLRPGPAGFAAIVFALLPVHPETVVWVTGRVDSMPALFYVGTVLLYAAWRELGRWQAYAGALALFFAALFSKQNTITMVGTLVAYDLLIVRGPPGPQGAAAWPRTLVQWSLPYLPFLGMTLGYMALRLALFGHVVRENALGLKEILGFGGTFQRHLSSVVVGDMQSSRMFAWLIVIGVGLAWLGTRKARVPRASHIGPILFFGPLWWVIGIAPTAVAGYESPRHVYLAAVGWCVSLGIVLDAVLHLNRSWRWRGLVTAIALGVLGWYGAKLNDNVRRYQELAAVSQQAVSDITREVLDGPTGDLIIVQAPGTIWAWSLPFALRPPFAAENLTDHAAVISPWELDCCVTAWFDTTREEIRRWAGGPSPRSVTILRWGDTPGEPQRLTAAELPELSNWALSLLRSESPSELDYNVRRLVEIAVDLRTNRR